MGAKIYLRQHFWLTKTEQTPSIAKFFTPSASKTATILKMSHTRPSEAMPSSSLVFCPCPVAGSGPEPHLLSCDVPCQHLHGEQYSYYLATTQTRSLGGVSVQRRAHVERELFPYKCFPTLKNDTLLPSNSALSVPDDGNTIHQECGWTKGEQQKLDEALRSYARWIVDPGARSIRSPKCLQCTMNPAGVCDACQAITKDEAFQHAINRVHSFFTEYDGLSLM